MIFKAISLFVHFLNTIDSKIRPVSYSRRLGVNVGSGVRIFSLHPGAFGSEPYLVTLEDGVVITAGVRFITHDGSTFIFRDRHPDLDVIGPISVGKNSFIGMGTTILPGVRIGENCVVGAMSVVSKSIPDGVVVVGSPARQVAKTEDFLARLLQRNARTGNLAPNAKRAALCAMKAKPEPDGRSWLKP